MAAGLFSEYNFRLGRLSVSGKNTIRRLLLMRPIYCINRIIREILEPKLLRL